MTDTNTTTTKPGELNERELPDDYPVYWDYMYVADGNVIRSDVQGTVRDLKRDTGAAVITSCDIFGRQELRINRSAP